MLKFINKYVLTVLVIFIFVLTFVSPSESANIKVTPSISLEEKYDSNIFNKSGDPVSDYIEVVKPELTVSFLIYKATLNVKGGFTWEFYNNNPDLNNQSAARNFSLGLGQMETIQITPRFTLTPIVRFIETRDFLKRNETLQSPTAGSPSVDTTGTNRAALREIAGEIQTSYLVTPTITTSAGVGYLTRNYTEASSELTNSSILSGDASARYLISPTFSSGVFFNTSRNMFKGFPDSTTYLGGVICGYKPSTPLDLSWRAGIGKTIVDAGDGTPGTSSAFPYINIIISYTSPIINGSIYGSLGQTGGGVFGKITDRFNIGITAEKQFEENWWWSIKADYQQNKSLDGGAFVNINTFWGITGVRYVPREWATVGLSATGFRQTSTGTEGDSFNRYSGILSITLGKTYNIF